VGYELQRDDALLLAMEPEVSKAKPRNFSLSPTWMEVSKTSNLPPPSARWKLSI